MPLPVTPLRRTERKRAPAPPTLMAKVNYGMTRVERDGKMVWDWVTAVGDTESLFKFARHVTGINYKADVVRLDQFTYAPENVPVMYFTGRQPFLLTDAQRNALRQYILDGGAILGAAGNGEDEFSKSFIREMRQIFPDRPWHFFPADHPLYSAHYKLAEIQYRSGATDVRKTPPQLEGINLGCRAAILLSRADLSCGWDNHTHPDGFRVMPEDAKKLGVNLLTYLLASYRLGRVSSTPIVFRESPDAPAEFEVGQIVHEGDWDPCPASLQYLLKSVSEETSAFVTYRRAPVNPASADLFKYPFLYLTGHLGFRLSDEAVSNLREYLGNGGFLLVSTCCNRAAFEGAVRREMAKVFPNDKLQPLDPGHAVYTAHYNTAQAISRGGRLEGITRQGVTAVIFSPGSMGSAWDSEPRPFVQLPDTQLARQMGINSVVYAMTH
ncbi:DUF4159 domain-containing protein [bacterium]|nr:DUF4159 domain-containing protein [bacterium]